jgi:dTDP-glucose 4,6-dehydratase
MIWQGKKVLVTGAGGFIGSHLTARLLELGADVRAMVRYNSRNAKGQLDDIEIPSTGKLETVAGDIRDSRFVRASAQDCEVVFHLAALIGIPYSYAAPSSYVDTNIVGTLNVLEAVRETGARRLVHTSTSEVYGSALYVPIDEKHPLQAQSPYSASKIAADKMVDSYHASFETPTVTVRPFNTYGPRQSLRAILPSLVQQALMSDEIRVGSVDPVRDLTYVSDTVNGFLQAATAKGVEGKTINLGTGTGYAVSELIEKACSAAGRHPKVVVEEQRIRPAASEVSRLISSNALARDILDWQPEVSIDEGIAMMLPWFRDNPNYYDASVYNV